MVYRIVFLIAMLAWQCSVSGALLVDKTPDLFNGLTTSDFGGMRQQASQFNLATDSIIEDIRWWGAYLHVAPGMSPPVDDFTIRIFDFGDEVDSSPMFEYQSAPVVRTLVAASPGVASQYAYEASFDGLPLQAGDYALSVVNDTSADPSLDWHIYLRCDLCAQYDGYSRSEDNQPWVFGEGEIGYQLLGAVPEPSGGLLLMFGWFGLISACNLRQQHS